MRAYRIIAAAAALVLGLALQAKDARTVVNIDSGWKFIRSDASGAQAPGFDDSSWRILDVPHDWAIEDDYDENSPVRRGGGYLGGGVGWYRKSLKLDQSYAGKKIYIEFGGVMQNSDVYINGQLLGHRPIGYLPLFYDITPYAKLDGSANTIAVRVDNTAQPASRWYCGAGIYRHVYIQVMDPLHLDYDSVFLSAVVSGDDAVVSAQGTLKNESDADRTVSVQTILTSPSGKKTAGPVSKIIVPAGKTVDFKDLITVFNPQIWDPETPNLYSAETLVKEGGKLIDSQKNSFGIRSFEFKSETGFWINGRNVKLYGVCLHNDGGAVGTAVPASVWERRMRILKQAGVNAVRGAHCPMDPSFYEAADKVGMLLFDETFDTWTAAKPNGQAGYNLYFKEWWKYDATAQLKRVRNHPSIILYSLGNEIRDNLNSAEGRQTYLDMRALTKEVDPTRPITMALFRPTMQGLFTNGFADYLDVIGQNYSEQILMGAWQDKPGRKIIGTENTPANYAWVLMRDNPYFSGQFLWTGLEYLGESDWPKISWNTALFNRNGGWKYTGWERRSWWSKEPMVRIWRKDDAQRGDMTEDYTPTNPNLKETSITVYNNTEEVELFVNGKSVGVQKHADNDQGATFTFAYEPGTVRAVGRSGGKIVAEHELKTASKPVSIEVKAEENTISYDWEKVVYVTATTLDKDGLRSPNGNNRITFKVSGPGELVSVDNNDVYSHERYKSDWRTAYKGQVIAIIRATAASGTITVEASSDGLTSGSATIAIR